MRILILCIVVLLIGCCDNKPVQVNLRYHPDAVAREDWRCEDLLIKWYQGGKTRKFSIEFPVNEDIIVRLRDGDKLVEGRGMAYSTAILEALNNWEKQHGP